MEGIKEKIETSQKPPIERILRPFQEFTRLEASGGILLLLCTMVALVWANSPWSDSYFNLWQTKLKIGLGSFILDKPIILWINDGLMAMFFFVVGLEIKREILVGELSSPKQATLPIVAALGGIVVPAVLYISLNQGKPGASGWGIPMATDIAFALGALAILGKTGADCA
jgi:NhaA family Na+:H+ antiporter